VSRNLLSAIPKKRQFLARSLKATGLLAFLEHLAGTRAADFVVLTYHRIAIPGMEVNPFYDPVISAHPEGFRTQLRMLRERCHMVNPEALVHSAFRNRTNSQRGKPAVLITFDDGYRDNLEVALPALLEAGVQAVFFVVTDFVQQSSLPWWDHIAYVVKQTNAERLRLPRTPGDPRPMEVNLGKQPTATSRRVAIATLIRAFLNREVSEFPWFLAQLEREAGVAVDIAAWSQKLFMNWEEVRRLAAAGMMIGSHGKSHARLADLDESCQRLELRESRRILGAALGREVDAVAYPFGGPDTITPTTIRLAADAGYRLGFTSSEGPNRPAAAGFDPLALRRLNVGFGDSPPLLRARVALSLSVGRPIL